MKIEKQKFKNSFRKGFSLGEVLLALFVLAFGITTSIYLMAGSMQDTMRSRDLLVAAMLSQEGTELVRNIRDNNITEVDSEGNHGDAFTGFRDGDCAVDYEYDTNSPNNADFLANFDCGSPSFDLYFSENDGNKFYTHSSTSQLTKFKRKIIIGNEGEGKKSVVSMVVWNRDDFPSDKSECFIGQNCTFSETMLTAWINFD